MQIEVLLSPAEYQSRQQRGFAGAVCVVFDVLRATSVMVTGLANGAAGFIPVEEIFEAVALGKKHPGALLAGERDGLRITVAHSGGAEFDLGNSPREFERARVRDRTIITTTTNGTRALRACVSADAVAVGSFLNLAATVKWLVSQQPARLVLVCAGTGESAALEDVLCAGAMCDLLALHPESIFEDSAEMALRIYLGAATDLFTATSKARNGRRLLANPELGADVAFCLQREVFPIVALLGADGVIRREVA